MDGPERVGRWANIRQRLGLKGMGMGCCGATWSPTASTLTTMETLPEQVEEENRTEPGAVVVGPGHIHGLGLGLGPQHAAPGMNLAMALAAERNSREGSEVGPTVQAVKSLMMLIEETDGGDWSIRRRGGGGGGGEGGDHHKRQGGVGDYMDSDWLCCVCMERGKGAAFIPCGHTFCRVCSREMWINRGMCPICNRPILEILDIY